MPTFKGLFFLFVLCASSILSAQVNLDSLYSLLPATKGTDKVDLFNTIAWELKFSDPAQALELCNESIDLSKSISYTQGEAQSLYQLGAFHYLKGDFHTSLDFSKRSITLFESINNSLGLAKNWNMTGLNLHRLNNYSGALENYEKAITTCKLFEYDELLLKVRGNIAIVYNSKGEYKKALEEYYLIASSWLEKKDSSNYYIVLSNIARSQTNLARYTEALSNYFEIEHFEKSSGRKRLLANNYNNIGELYLRLGLGKQTAEMFEKGIQLYQEIGNRRKVGIEYENLGIYYSDNEELEKADSFYHKALHIYDSLGLHNTGRIYNNIATIKIKTEQFDKALTLLEKSLKINLAIGSKKDIALNYANMGAVYFELEQIQKSEQYYLKSLDIWTEIGSVFDKQKAAEGLAKIYKLTNNNEAYELYSSIAQAANDSLFNKQKLIEINRLLVTNLYDEHQHKTKELNTELSIAKDQLALLKGKDSSFFRRYKVWFISFLTLLTVGVFWGLKRYKGISQLNSKLQDKTKEDQEKFNDSLKSKNKELTLLSLETAQQSDFLKKIHDSLQQLISKYPESPEIKKLEKILIAHSIDQHNWEKFTVYFNEVYAGFFDRLSKSFPTITNKELRLCALIRLKIPTYEASIILGISPRSIHKSRYRIRKKMELDTEANIDEFICSV